MSEQRCPCGSGAAYADCCAPYIEGRAEAPSAEALMRSRYTAYCRDDRDYIARTWDPATRPALVDSLEHIDWVALKIQSTEGGSAADDTGSVGFVAHYQIAGKPGYLRELSRFRKDSGKWLYVSGETERLAPVRVNKTGRNEACPCGSGKKYKRCCGM